MALEADLIIDRRRNRKKLTFWRVATFAALAFAVVALAVSFAGDASLGKTGSHIAKVKIEGTIFEDDELVKRLEDIAESDAVKGLLLAVDSPGGTTAGGEMIYNAIRRIADKKPVVAQVGTIAASGGYMVAVGADHIVARQTSIIGSIGVLVQYPDVTGLMDKIGVRMESIKSSPLKAEPSPFNPTTAEERAVIRALILDTYNWFVDLVAERRPFDRSDALELANGAVFSGRQSLGKKLIDSLGGEREAIAWLETKGVAENLDVIEWKPVKTGAELLLSSRTVRHLAGYLGLSASEVSVITDKTDRIFLDGLLSVWHPDGNVN